MESDFREGAIAPCVLFCYAPVFSLRWRGDERLEQGREKGQLEMGISIALAMLEAGEPEEKILRYTGFSPAQLAEMRDGRKSGGKKPSSR